MTLFQLAIRCLYLGEGIGASNRDFQFTSFNAQSQFCQDLCICGLSVSLGFNAISGHSLKVDNGIDALRSHAKLECQFDVISTECINKGVDLSFRSRTNAFLDA